ncbi:unnamed protein product [Clonostachys solani]|uniref:Uncharacterized protein n=1 Tax=Clonostachys solani TaxID=160281 RepID=A0A9N9ZKL5_9HYPO|nr:unnamed protein product [Clonostachys solani]
MMILLYTIIRDKLVIDKGVLYFKIEAASLINYFLCLVIYRVLYYNSGSIHIGPSLVDPTNKVKLYPLDLSINANYIRKLHYKGIGCGKTILSVTMLDYLIKGSSYLILSFFFDFSNKPRLAFDKSALGYFLYNAHSLRAGYYRSGAIDELILRDELLC